MRYDWIDAYLLAKRSVTKDLQPDWNWIRYHIGGKMFAAVLLDNDNRPYYINVKLDPLEGQALRRQYEDILPGYYSNKQCWNSVRADGLVPDELLRRMLDTSYRLVLSGFSKQKQREILGLSVCGTDCGACPLYPQRCPGCNAVRGKVFHAPEGQACPIFACAGNKKRLASCASCDQMPCAIWRGTKDPALSEEAFQNSIDSRTQALKTHFPRE